ncbi:sialate O-acetylesterase [Bremerella cremea]|uniref:sialate O-acetylesterase n=1 Tax=Bremerella cremea TaxID=1031537 RepID=UPI0031E9D7C5
MKWFSALLLGICFLTGIEAIDAAPVKVFVLCGQSNMEGKGAIKHLEQLLADPNTAEAYKHLRDENGWVERDDVWIKYNDDRGQGKLAPGFATPTNRFGPELGFGNVVGDAFDEKVLIIKCAWGGRALAVEFRPPSSGVGDYTRRNRETKEMEPLPKEDYGVAYRDTIRIVKETLANIDQVVPDYDKSQGYELSGFVFFQGFNDIIDQKKTDEYGANLANLVRDVRKDLDAPNLPFVIGELGQQGVEPEKRYAEKHFAFRKSQEDVSKLPEFVGTVRYVKTSPYVISDGESFDGGYHYYGRADSFYNFGKAFGEAMVDMTKKQ